jgi:solute carrier family 45 protein 1/2/4
LANNTVQGPCRALLADIAPKDQQNLGGAFFSIMLGESLILTFFSQFPGLGNFFGYTLGGAPLIKIFPFFGTNLRAVFSIAIVNLVICVGITLFAVKEKILEKSDVVAVDNPFVTIGKGVRNMPPAMRRVCVVQFFTWYLYLMCEFQC